MTSASVASRRSRPLLLVVGAVLVVSGGLLFLLGRADAGEPSPEVERAGTSGPGAAEAQAQANADPAMVAAGEDLYLRSCVSCHGVGGKGTAGYPSLIGVGAASADFYLRTGRMPLAYPSAQPPQKAPAFDDTEIRQLVAYVASLGDGPPVPDVDPDRGDIALGSELFLANCAACHNSAGVGGALSYGAHAPPLLDVDPTQIGEAMHIGPGQMPVFGPDTFDQHEMDSIVAYVRYLQEPEHPGGLMIGRVGPVPEGFVAWLVGLGALILVIRWITRERARA
jgi:ubiquinol-cytochrome c reductase cytochrome c subunit